MQWMIASTMTVGEMSDVDPVIAETGVSRDLLVLLSPNPSLSLGEGTGSGPRLVSMSEPHICHPGAEQHTLNSGTNSFFRFLLEISREWVVDW